RMFTYFSAKYGTPVALLRLNYAVEMRYGVLLDIATAVSQGQPVDVAMGHVNLMWQGDANEVALRALLHASSPPTVLNLTGPETVSVRQVATRFGERLGKDPVFIGEDQDSALLNDASRSHALFGYPSVALNTLIDWVATWVAAGSVTHGQPAKFQVRTGRF